MAVQQEQPQEEERGMEHRIQPRIPLECDVFLENDRGGKVLNLSVGGCALQTSKTFQMGEHLEFELQLPDDVRALRIPLAKIRWAHKPHYGVEFLKVTGEHEARLTQLVNAYVEPGRGESRMLSTSSVKDQ